MRNGSIELEDDNQERQTSKEPTMTDLKTAMDAILTRLNATATKVDVANINDKIAAQNVEIDQLKNKMVMQEDNLKKLQSLFDEGLAASLQRKLGSADPSARMSTSNMAASERDRVKTGMSTRWNLIIEGLEGVSEDEMCLKLIEVCASINITLYKSEIESITRFTRRDNTTAKPGPVLVTISRTVLRDSILMKKGGLMQIGAMKSVFINADEPLEVRRAKSVLRKVARVTKQQGIEIEFRHDRIKIEGQWYTTNDIDKIPNKFLPITEEDAGASGGVPSKLPMIIPLPDVNVPKIIIRPHEKMRLTRAGLLLFSGPNAFPSNMHYAPITVNDKDFDSNEQSFQITKALDHGCKNVAEDIKKMKNSFEIKKEGGRITTTVEWEEGAPEKLWDLMEIKYRQHPELLDRLIETAPLQLMEASTDTRWGGGALLIGTVW